MDKSISIIDTTLRDGGLVNNHFFEEEFVKKLYKTNIAAGIDYMEFGYRADKSIFDQQIYGKWKFSSDEDIRRIVGDNNSELKISIMADVGRCNYIKDFRSKSESPVDLIRVATYINSISDAIRMIEYAERQGYETTCNIMAISEYTYDDIYDALKILSDTSVKAVYIVDSYGALYPNDVRNYVDCFREILNPKNIEIGIHTHNNQQCALANTIEAMEQGGNWMDASMYGMGRGAGNCYLEALVGYLRNDKYNLEPILEFVQEEMIPLSNSGITWGYNTFYMLTGLANVHPKAAIYATKQNAYKYTLFKNELK